MISKNINIIEDTIANEFSIKTKKDAKGELFRIYAPIIVFVSMSILAIIFVDNFFSTNNIQNLLYQMTIPLILATGLTFIMLVGSIDLSIEGVMGFTASAVAILVKNNITPYDLGIFGIIIAIVIGTLVGMLTGFLHVKLRIPSFVVTFAMSKIMTGVGLLCYKSKGSPPAVSSELFNNLSTGTFLGIPYVTWFAFMIFILGIVILNYTAFGRAVYALGDNETAAGLAGINIKRTKIIAFAICACTASIAGIIGTIRLKIGQVGVGSGHLFPTITAVTVGGIATGKGGMLQTIIGVLIYTELVNLIVMLGVDPFYKEAIQGVIILIAVALSIKRERKMIVK